MCVRAIFSEAVGIATIDRVDVGANDGLAIQGFRASFETAEKTIKVRRACITEKMGVVSVAKLVRMSQHVGIEPASANLRQ
jgi:hypothetical protein